MFIDKEFFNRNAEIVAKELLGKILVRKIGNKKLKALIIETEAYFDEKDPASRARQNGDLRDTMKMNPGTILVYGIHNNWLMNIVTDKEGIASAVLVRAIEPINFHKKSNGPGLLTKALQIDKNFHKMNIINNKKIWVKEFNSQEGIGNTKSINLESEKSMANKPAILKDNKLIVKNNKNNFEIIESFRIGVKKDLPKKLRFYIKDNEWVSRE